MSDGTFTGEEMYRLVERYCAGEITADDYYAAVDVLALRMVEAEIRDMGERRKKP